MSRRSRRLSPRRRPQSRSSDPTPAPTTEPSTPVGTPTIQSDLADYPPGGLVTLTGSGWQPGESVHIFVNDDWGSSWSRNVDVTADASGAIVDQFELPLWFVALYTVVASGDVSGSATTSFTDSNMQVRVQPGGSGGISGTHVFVWGIHSGAVCANTATSSGSTSAGTGFALVAAVTQTPSQSLKITAPAISGWVFNNWTKGSTTLTGNPVCLVPDGNTGNDNWSANYLAASNGTTTTIARTAGPNPSIYGTAVTFTATVAASPAPGNVGTVTFKDGATIVCAAVALSSNQASCSPALGAGGHTLTAEYSGGLSGANNFLPSTSSGLSHTVTKKALSVNAVANTKVYGAADPSFTWTFSGFAFSDDASNSSITGLAACSRTAGETVAGNPYTITCASGTLLAPNYSFVTGTTAHLTIGARPITVTANPQTKVYGEGDPALTYQITSGSLAFSDDFTGGLARDTGEDVGTYAISQGDLALTGNYALTFIGDELTVTVRPITVTADPQTKVYGEGDPALTYQITSGSLAFSDDFTGGLARDTGEDVGTYAISQGDLALTGNYALTFIGDELTVTVRPITVTANPQTKVYGEGDPALTYQITSGSLAFSDDFTGGLARDTGEDVGTYAISQGDLALTGNYALTFIGDELTVTKKTLSVNAVANTKVYGAADPSFTWTFSGFAFSDDASNSSITGLAACSRTAGETVAGNPYTITCASGTLLAPNYSFVTGTTAHLTIAQKNVTGAFTAADKVWDGTTATVVKAPSSAPLSVTTSS